MSSDSEFVISREKIVAQWAAVLDAERVAREARERFDVTAAFLRAQGLGDWIPAEPPGMREERRKGKKPQKSGTWTSEVLAILDAHPDGIMSTQLRERLAETSMAPKLHANPNGYYNAVSLLQKQGEIFKYGSRLVAKQHHDAYLKKVENGDIADADDERQGTVLHRLTTFVNGQPDGIGAGDIVKAMEAEGMNSGSVYNNLSKAVFKKRISRRGKLYFPLFNENGPPAGSPETGE